MKLRHKQTQQEYENAFKEFRADAPTNSVYDVHGELHIFKTSVMEPVQPEPQWVDVTADVEVREEPGAKGTIPMSGNAVFHGPRRLANLVCGGGYRLRKADILIQNGHAVIPGVAFIVERRHDD